MSWFFNDSVTGALFVLCIITSPICILATGLRFSASRRAFRKLSREDWSALAATIIHLVYISMTLVVLTTLRGRNPLELAPEELLFLGKCVYGTSPLFAVNQLFSKFSILFLYVRIFGINRAYIRWIYAIGAVHVAYCIMVLPIYLFSCRPISKAWDFSQTGTCLNYLATVTGAEIVNSAVDFAMVVLALWMIRALRIGRATKWKLNFIFALGGLAGVIGFVKIGESYSGSGVINFTTGVWSIVQMTFSIVCCCAPTYKAILPTDNFFGHLLSQVTTNIRSWPRSFKSVTPKPSTSSLARNQTNSKNGNQHRGAWHEIGGDSSQRGLAWSEASASHDNTVSPNDAGYQIKTISIRQNVDLV